MTAVYAHNDEMALGAIAAIKAAGKQPGKDIQIVTIDGTKGGMDAIAAGELGASVQSSPFFGPLACDVAQTLREGRKDPDVGQGLGPLLRQEQRAAEHAVRLLIDSRLRSGFYGTCFLFGLLALPLSGAGLTFFAAAKKVSKESSFPTPILASAPLARSLGVVQPGECR